MKKFIFLIIFAAAMVYGYFWYVRDIELYSYLRRIPTGLPITWTYSDPPEKPLSETGTWFEAAPLPRARTGAAAAVVGETIYVFGGLDGFGRVMNTVSSFETRRGVWQDLAPMPLPLHHAIAAEMDGLIYVVGGFQHWGRSSSDKVFIFNPNDGRWQDGPPLLKGVAYASAADGDHKLHVVGGRNSVGPLSDHFIFDPQQRSWSNGEELIAPRYNGAAITVGEKFYVLGGRSESLGGELSDFMTLNLKEGSWDGLDNMPTRRGGFGLIDWQNKLYAFGGQAMTTVYDRVEVYDMTNRHWTIHPPMPEARRDFAIARVGDAVFIIGGSPRGNFSVNDRVFVFMPDR